LVLWHELTAIQSSLPVNVTNWDDDPVEQHPEIDSVGTESLWCELGVEMFDCGAGTGCGSWPDLRSSRAQLCQGLQLTPEALLAGAPALAVGDNWAPDPPNTGRPNVEIYNMPSAMQEQQPALQPVAGKSIALYTFVSDVPEDQGAGIVYPKTADRQAVAIVAKAQPTDLLFSRGIVGLELELLTPESHEALLEFLLVDLFGLGGASAP